MLKTSENPDSRKIGEHWVPFKFLDEEPIGIIAFCLHLEARAACAAFQDDVASPVALVASQPMYLVQVNGIITMKMT